MFLLEDARTQRLFGIVRENRHNGLDNDRALIALFIDEMHRAARKTDTVLKRFFLHMKPGKGRQQRRMDVHDAIRICFDEHRRK